MISGDKIFLQDIAVECNGDYRNKNGNHNNNNNNNDNKQSNNSYDGCFVNAARKKYPDAEGGRSGGATSVTWKDEISISISVFQHAVHNVVDPLLSVKFDSSHVEESVEQRDTPNEEIRMTLRGARSASELGTVVDRRTEDTIDLGSVLERRVHSPDIGSNAEESGCKKPKVPDGGWGWMVVLASLVISMIADGVSYSFGLLYIEFLLEFGASKSKTAWIGSLFMAVPLLSGPIMSALVDRYGCRSMTIVGGLISGLGFILSSFGNTIEVMYLTFGVIAGLGLGLCYVTAVVSVAYWFEKKRNLAVGLAACGTGIGTFVYAPLTTYFINEYGWRGTCLLLAGTFFNMIVSGTIMKDPEWWIIEQRKNDQVAARKSHARSYDTKSDGSPSDRFPGVEELRKLLRGDSMPESLAQNLNTTVGPIGGARRRMISRSAVNLPTYAERSEKVSGRFTRASFLTVSTL